MHIVVYSGGMDSFTLLHKAAHACTRRGVEWQHGLMALSFDYGQRHKKELDYAKSETLRMGIRHEVIDLSSVTSILRGSALTDKVDVPHGHYAADSMRKTVVPGRNTFMLSLAMALAEGLPRGDWQPGDPTLHTIWFGAHAGDHHIYPDCRADFVYSMRDTMRSATEGLVTLQAPFLYLDKEGILIQGKELGLGADDYGRTWTCYEGGDKACGKCGSCQERLEAFDRMGWRDPHAPA